MGKWISAGKYGLRYREHATETVGAGRGKRPLRYYAAVYKSQGKTVTDAYGWEGLDFHNEDNIAQTALPLRTKKETRFPHSLCGNSSMSASMPTLHFLKKTSTYNKRRRYLSPEEADLLLNKIRETSEQTYRICLLSLNSGLRFGEIASLRWQHINTDRREIIIIDPKNGESRSVYMTEAVQAMFNDMEKGDFGDLAYPSRTGGKMASILKTFARAVSAKGSLTGECGSFFTLSGTPVRLGWSTPVWSYRL